MPKVLDLYRTISGLSIVVPHVGVAELVELTELILDRRVLGCSSCTSLSTLACVASGIENPNPIPGPNPTVSKPSGDLDLSTSHPPIFLSDGRTLIFLLAFLPGNSGNGA